MGTKKKLAIVGIFWDGYYDMWEDFLELKEKFWKDCPYPMYIVNQTKDLAYKKTYDVTVLHAGNDAEYSKKVQVALEQIDADYYLLLLEDFFLSQEVTGDIFTEILQYMESNGIFYYTMPMPEFMNNKQRHDATTENYLQDIPVSKPHPINCQPSIWERNFLKKLVGNGNYNAWVFEGIYLKSQKAHTVEFLRPCKMDLRNILHLKHGALQGKMLPNVVKYYEGIGYSLKTKRPILSNKVVFKRWVRFHTPDVIINLVKKIINKRSVSSRYLDQIYTEMKALNLE